MDLFRTFVEIEKSNFAIDFNSKLLFIGSCFTENIGNKFNNLCFQTLINPFGIIYNPKSICENLEILLENRTFTEKDLFCYNDLWFSFSHHGKFSNLDKKICLENINQNIKKASSFIQSSDFLFITLGTSWIYKYLKTNKIVANCHKIPGKEFEKSLLSVDVIFDDFSVLYSKIRTCNPNLKIIFTVSPVRHWKDGVIENQLSKSILFVAIHKLIKKFDTIYYFPSYEIQMDELRDYRFYNDDMLHPSQVAVDYIWKRLSDTFFDEETKNIIKEIEKITKALNHIPFNPNSDKYKKHLETINDKIILLEKRYKYLNLCNLKTFM